MAAAESQPLCRRAAADDAEQIAGIIAELIEEPQPVAFERALSAGEVRDAWLGGEDGGAAVFVIEGGGRLLAFAVVEPLEGATEDCSLGAWVRSEERRKGYATVLAEEALAFTRERGYQAIRARLPEGQRAGALVSVVDRRAGAARQPPARISCCQQRSNP